MKTIYKYNLEITDGPQAVQLPSSYDIVKVANQHGEIAMWVELDNTSETQDTHFVVHGTGHDMSESYNNGSYVGTAMVGDFVWHIYHRL